MFNIILRSDNAKSGQPNDFTLYEDVVVPPAEKYRVKLNYAVIQPYTLIGQENILDNEDSIRYFQADFTEIQLNNIGTSNLYDNGYQNRITFHIDNDFNPVWETLAGDNYGSKQTVYECKTEYILNNLNFKNLNVRLIDDGGNILIDNSGVEPYNCILSLCIEPLE